MEKREKMKIAGVICELNPPHWGHAHLLRQARQDHEAVVCVLSGNFVQRGEPALLDKWARTELALSLGADLVLELPVSWACAGAERFAAGGVALLSALGNVETLVFGSEIPDTAGMEALADTLLSPAFSQALAALPETGEPFARRREQVIAGLLGEEAAALLRQPNAILGVEYCKALRAQGLSLRPRAILREGAGHDQPGEEGGLLSAGELRRRFLAGESLAGLAPAETVAALEELAAKGWAPLEIGRLERAILCKLRTMDEADFAALPDVSEGLEHRLYQAARQAGSLEELLSGVKSKRVSLARVRRLVLAAFLGLAREQPALLPYLRVLGLTELGKAVLGQAIPTLPVLSRPAQVTSLSEGAQALFRLECRVDDLAGLACPAPWPAGRTCTEKLRSP